MGNMGYCRFENTLGDLEDCYDHINDTDLGPEESRARKRLIDVCIDIVNDTKDEVEEEG